MGRIQQQNRVEKLLKYKLEKQQEVYLCVYFRGLNHTTKWRTWLLVKSWALGSSSNSTRRLNASEHVGIPTFQPLPVCPFVCQSVCDHNVTSVISNKTSYFGNCIMIKHWDLSNKIRLIFAHQIPSKWGVPVWGVEGNGSDRWREMGVRGGWKWESEGWREMGDEKRYTQLLQSRLLSYIK